MRASYEIQGDGDGERLQLSYSDSGESALVTLYPEGGEAASANFSLADLERLLVAVTSLLNQE